MRESQSAIRSTSSRVTSIIPSIIELRRPRAFVCRHLLCMFQEPAVLQVNRDPFGPEGLGLVR
jgi:hypothetical protein